MRGFHILGGPPLAALVVALSGAGASSGCREPEVALQARESWCPEGFEPGFGDTCFALPAGRGVGMGVILYLHGMYQGHGSDHEWAMVRSATAHGFAVMLPRGHRGLCDWKPDLRGHFCWPGGGAIADETEMKSLVSDWDRTLWQIDELLEGGPHRRYVLAFSNGAFFAAHLVRRGLFRADGWALVSGGSPGEEPATSKVRPPVLLLSAAEDAEQGPRLKALGQQLAGEKWPVTQCSRSGGHVLSGDDVDAALRFFRGEPPARKISCAR